MLIKSTLVLVLAAVAVARDAVLNRGVLMGVDTSNKDASPREIFERRENHPMATATMIRVAAEMTNFHPNVMSPKELCEHFDMWKEKVVDFPGFTMKRHPRPASVHMEGGEEKLAMALKHGLGKLQVAHADKVAMEFIYMVPEMNEDRSLKEFIFNVIVIDKPQDSKHLMVRMIELNMDLDTSFFTKKVTIPDQTIRMQLTEMEVDSNFLTSHAEQLSQRVSQRKQLTTIADWMWMMTSPRKNDYNEPVWWSENSEDRVAFGRWM